MPRHFTIMKKGEGALSHFCNITSIIKYVKDMIVDLKKKLNKEKLDKRNLLRAHEDEDNSLQYQFHKYNQKNILPTEMDTLPTIN